jgi:pyruvate dehydrogenase kinase 2/3/4
MNASKVFRFCNNTLLLNRIHEFAQMTPRPVTLQQLLLFGANPTRRTLLQGAQYLHKELQIRYSQRLFQLAHLPYNCSELPSFQCVRKIYLDYADELFHLPYPETGEEEERFTEILREWTNEKTQNVVPLIAQGIQEFKASQTCTEVVDSRLTQALDKLFSDRIGTTLLINQHIALHEEPVPGFIGLIQGNCNPSEVAKNAIMDAQEICHMYLGDSPQVELLGNTDLTFNYMPSHLHHMIFELLKNSLRAVIEYHGPNVYEYPPIKVIIARGKEDIIIKISDVGGGISRSATPKIFSYLYTTAQPIQNYEIDQDPSPLAGLGVGLPLCRLYARYFGGDLQLISMESFGTDVYLYLNRLGHVQESISSPLPLYSTL